MIQYTYDHELITMTNMFLNSMSTIIVKRFNVNKQARDQIKTRIVYAPKQRVLNDLLNRDQNLQLPVVAVTIGGITRDQNRVFNKIMGSFHNLKSTEDKSYHERTPLPIDIKYNVSILTRYQQDMDQIISNIIPYINPYFTVSWRTPARPDFEIRSNIFWDGNVNIQYPNDINATQVARVAAELSFTFKGWIFQAVQDPVSIVFSTHSSFTDISKAIQINEEFLLAEVTDRESTDVTDYIEYYGKFPQPSVIEPHYANVGESKTFNVWGKGFKSITNVYLSGNPFPTSTLQDPFSGISALSANNPPFTAVKLDQTTWTYNKDNLLTFDIPQNLTTTVGRAQLIVEGPYGYGKLTDHVRVNTFNPFVEGTSQYYNHVPYQLPYLDGIIIGQIPSPNPLDPLSSVSFTIELSADTDGDGYTNLAELSAGTDPNDANSFPSSLFSVFNGI